MATIFRPHSLFGYIITLNMEEMRQKGKKKKWNKDVKEHFNKELSKMQRMNPQVAEYSTQRNYLELFLELPFLNFV